MRILFVHETLGFQGGVEQTVADMAEGLWARGHVCELAYGPRRGADREGFRRRFDDAWPWHELDARLRAAEASPAPYAVVYVHKAPTIEPLEPWHGRVRIVRMIHDHDVTCPRRHRYSAWTHEVCPHPAGWRCWLDGAFVGKRDGRPAFVDLRAHMTDLRRHDRLSAVLVGSRYMRDQMVLNGMPQDRVHVLPPLVKRGAPPMPLPTEPHVLFVGQLIRGKGVDLMLRALARVAGPWRATIVGDGNMRGELERLCQALGLQEKVSFAGWLAHHEVERMYETARVVVVPSRWPEPFGMVGVEALQRGRPVVAFEVGGIPDWLVHDQNGLMAKAGDIEGMGEAVGRILTDDALARRLSARAIGIADALLPQTHFTRLEAILEGTIDHERTSTPCESASPPSVATADSRASGATCSS